MFLIHVIFLNNEARFNIDVYHLRHFFVLTNYELKQLTYKIHHVLFMLE